MNMSSPGTGNDVSSASRRHTYDIHRVYREPQAIGPAALVSTGQKIVLRLSTGAGPCTTYKSVLNRLKFVSYRASAITKSLNSVQSGRTVSDLSRSRFRFHLGHSRYPGHNSRPSAFVSCKNALATGMLRLTTHKCGIPLI